MSFSRLELDVDFEIGRRAKVRRLRSGARMSESASVAYFWQSEGPTSPSVRANPSLLLVGKSE